MKQVRAVIYGVVQGVGFRYHIRQVAENLGVTGFVRNQADGSVELVATGSEAQVDALLDWAHQGPNSAHVTQVNVTPYLGTTGFDSFTIER